MIGDNLGSTRFEAGPSTGRVGGSPCGSIELINSSAVRCLNVSQILFEESTASITVGGQTATASVFVFAGAPIVDSVSPSSGGVDGGYDIVITG